MTTKDKALCHDILEELASISDVKIVFNDSELTIYPDKHKKQHSHFPLRYGLLPALRQAMSYLDSLEKVL